MAENSNQPVYLGRLNEGDRVYGDEDDCYQYDHEKEYPQQEVDYHSPLRVHLTIEKQQLTQDDDDELVPHIPQPPAPKARAKAKIKQGISFQLTIKNPKNLKLDDLSEHEYEPQQTEYEETIENGDRLSLEEEKEEYNEFQMRPEHIESPQNDTNQSYQGRPLSIGSDHNEELVQEQLNIRYNNLATGFISDDGRSESVKNGLSIDGTSQFEHTRDQREAIKASLQNDLLMCDDFESNKEVASLHQTHRSNVLFAEKESDQASNRFYNTLSRVHEYSRPQTPNEYGFSQSNQQIPEVTFDHQQYQLKEYQSQRSNGQVPSSNYQQQEEFKSESEKCNEFLQEKDQALEAKSEMFQEQSHTSVANSQDDYNEKLDTNHSQNQAPQNLEVNESLKYFDFNQVEEHKSIQNIDSDSDKCSIEEQNNTSFNNDEKYIEVQNLLLKQESNQQDDQVEVESPPTVLLEQQHNKSQRSSPKSIPQDHQPLGGEIFSESNHSLHFDNEQIGQFEQTPSQNELVEAEAVRGLQEVAEEGYSSLIHDYQPSHLETHNILLNQDMQHLYYNQAQIESHYSSSNRSLNRSLKRSLNQSKSQNESMQSENDDNNMNDQMDDEDEEDDRQEERQGGEMHFEVEPIDDYGDNLGKWDAEEGQLKEGDNDINEIESLDFSVKREELQHQALLSQLANPYSSHLTSIILPSHHQHNNTSHSGLGGESMLIFQSPRKDQSPPQNSRNFGPQFHLEEQNSNPLNNRRQNNSTLQIVQQVKPDKVAVRQKSKKREEKKSIQRIKDLFSSEEKFQKFERLHSKETFSSQRKRRGFDVTQDEKLSLNMSSLDNSGVNNFTFKPKIDAISTLITQSQMDESTLSQRSSDPCLFLYQRGMQIKAQKLQQREELRKASEERQLNDCTFQPNQYKQSQQNSSLPRIAEHLSFNPSDMYQRSLNWEKQRKDKLMRQQEHTRASETQGCTFRPVIRDHSSISRIYAGIETRQESTSAKKTDRIINIKAYDSQISKRASYLDIQQRSPIMQDKSVQKYLDRQQLAKAKKLEKDLVFTKNDGSKWKNTVTKPKPPKITDIIIQNLQKKLDKNSQPASMKSLVSRNGKVSQAPTNEQRSREPSTESLFKKGLHESPSKKSIQGKPLEFKEAVKFLRNALHNLDLDN